MWQWPPASSAPSLPPSAFPNVQHVPGHPSFTTSRLTTPPTGFSSSQPSYYSSLPSPNVRYSGSSPQTLPLSSNWAGGHTRSPAGRDDNMTYLQTQQQNLSDPVVHSPRALTPNSAAHPLQERSSYAHNEESYQRSVFAPPAIQSGYQAPPSSQQQSGHVVSNSSLSIRTYHQTAHPLSTDSHKPAFHSPSHSLPISYQTGMETLNSSHDFQRTPSGSSPFQPPRLIEGSLDQCPPELVGGSVDSSSGLIQETREGLGYTVTGGHHTHSSPFSVDFLLRDRSSVDGELSSDQQQTGYPAYPHQQHTDANTLLSLHPLTHPTDEDERPFSPPELVPIETTLSKDEAPTPTESHDSHKAVDQCQLTKSGGKSSPENGNQALFTSEDDATIEENSVPFQLAEPGIQKQNEVPKSPSPVDLPQPNEGNKDMKKNVSGKYISPLIRHQRNRGYDSSDDDDVFLPNPNSNVVMETENKPTEEEEPQVIPEVTVSTPSVPPLIPSSGEKGVVVIKRGRGTAKTLDLQKLQLPLSQGWRRLVRKRIGPDQIRVDICYIAPEGRRLRTFPEIQSHLDSTQSTELTLDHFTFSKKVDLGEVLDGVIGETSPRGRRGRGRGRGRGVKSGEFIRQDPTASIDGAPPNVMAVPSPGRGRGRGKGGRGRGSRPRKTAESATRGEPSQLATHSTRAPPVFMTTPAAEGGGQTLDGSAQGIGAVSRATAMALIQKAIKETNLEPDQPKDGEGSVDARLLPAREVSTKDEIAMATSYSVPGAEQAPQVASTAPPTTVMIPPPAMIPDKNRTLDPSSDSVLKTQSSEDGLSILSSSAISTQVFSSSQPPPTSYAFHMHTPSSLGTSLQGAGRTTGRGRGRKRKNLTRPSSSDAPLKRPRGRPKGSGAKVTGVAGEGGVKKRRGRKPKVVLPNTSHTIMRPLAPSHGVAGAMAGVAPPTSVMDGGEGMTSAGQGEGSVSQNAKEEKRRQLLLKARADKARKKEVRNFQRSLAVNQRKLAQRQRRDRERLLMKQAREKQEKLSRQKEAEDREMRRQTAACQREVDNQRRARERTLRLLAHLKQQEAERSRRLYQQQLEMEKMAQLKRPVEDLEVRESSALPLLPSLGWVQLPSRAFADLLMVLEFGRSFSEFLEIDGVVPSLPDVYLGLYNHDEGKVAMDLLVQLFKAVLHDPGTRTLTLSGSQLGDVVVTPLTVSELLRLYLWSEQSDGEATCSDLTQITAALKSSPLQCLRPSQKVAVLSHLVKELLDSVSLSREVDTRMEQVASLRREKWKISLKMKRFRSKLSSVYGVGEKTRPVPYSGRGRPPKRAMMGGVTGDVGESSDEGEEGEVDGGGVVSDGEYSEEPTDEETPEAKEELQQRLKALKKKFVAVRKRIHSSSRLMRKFPLGQDRYARQYWVLPSVGGVIIEGVETSLDTNLQVIDNHAVPAVGVAKQELDQSEVGVASQTLDESNTPEASVEGQVEQETDKSESSKEEESNETVSSPHTPEQAQPDVTPGVPHEEPTSMAVNNQSPLNSDPYPTSSSVASVAHGHLPIEEPQTTSTRESSESSSSTESPSSAGSPGEHSLTAPMTVENCDPQTTAPQNSSDPQSEEMPATSLACSESMTGEESKDSLEETVAFPASQSHWFSLAPRHPCEVTHLAYQAPAQQQQQQQYIVAGPTAQYAYLTPDGQVVAAGGVPQVGMSYGIVGNTMVQVPQNQYIAMDSSTGMVLSQQPAAGVPYAIAGGDGGVGPQYVTVGGTSGYVAVGGAGQMVVQSDGAGQMVVVQDQNGQQSLVSLPTHNSTREESGKQPTEVILKQPDENPPSVAGPPKDISIKREKEKPSEVVKSPLSNAVRVRDGEEVAVSEAVKTVTSAEMVAHGDDKQQVGDQYVTAMVPGGPDGAPRYVSLPADPRVLSGQCSYAVLQQPDGSQQIVLVDNNSIGTYQGGGGGTDSSTSVMAMETPPPSLMDNEREGEGFMTPITLMYAQEPLSFASDGASTSASGTTSGNGSGETVSKEKALRELLEEQHIDLTHGWWSMTHLETVDRLLRTMCTRGVREKCLAKRLQKNKDIISGILNPSLLEAFKSTFKEHLSSLQQPSVCGGVSTHTEGETEIESSAEGVKMETEVVKMETEGVKTETDENPSDECVKPETLTTNDLELTNHSGAEQSCDMNDPAFPRYSLSVLLAVVEYLENMQQRLLTAQLQNEGVEAWEDLRSKVSGLGHTPQSLLLVSENLLELERSINRVHLKPPLRDKKLYLEEQERNKASKSRLKHDRISLAVRRDSTQLELPSNALQIWREAVGVASSASQLAVCMSELEVCIAWEKSSTIVFCQECHGGENESLLLLCDRCDKGTHTYCCKPKLSIVPEGDWFCYKCVTSNSKYRPCYVCDSKRGVLLSCAVCPRNYHKRCLNPPLCKLPPNPWKCPNCKHKPIPQSRLKDSSHSSRKRNKTARTSNEIYHTILKELESHDDAWPFLAPVVKKKFPAYYKVVKSPMDLQTIRSKLEEGRYLEDRDSFAADVRLIFSNCAYFNEDDSEVGLAGHNMSDFFEKKWSKL